MNVFKKFRARAAIPIAGTAGASAPKPEALPAMMEPPILLLQPHLPLALP